MLAIIQSKLRLIERSQEHIIRMVSESNNWSSDSEEEDEESEVVATVAAVAAYYFHRCLIRKPSHNRPYSGWDNLLNLLNNVNERRCYENLRMRPHVFYMLCETLVHQYGLRGTPKVTLQEKVATFLMAIGIGQLQEFYQRSGYTTTKNIRQVLRACLKMSKNWIRSFNDPSTLNPRIAEDTRYFPLFKDCIDALDRTHIAARLPANAQIPFIRRKWVLTQNILAICDFDMYFTYVLPGWEGSAHDARILSDAINDPRKEFPMPPPGYPNSIDFMAPYKGQKYHLPDFYYARTYNECEKFNHVHSSLRSAIERAFGIWKAKFHILNDMPVGYSFEMQSAFVCSTMALHNFIRRRDNEDRDFVEFNIETMTTDTSSNDDGPSDTLGDQIMNSLRDHICRQINSKRPRG